MDYQSITSASYFGVGQSTPLTTTNNSSNEIDRHHDFSTTDASISSSVPKENSSTDSISMVEKALIEAALPKNERNLSIVQELLKQELSINKNNILDLLKLSAVFRDIPIETLVLMKKLNLPITADTIAQIQSYQQNGHLMLNQSLQLIDSLISLLTESKMTSIELQETILSILQSDCSKEDATLNTLLQQDFSKEELQKIHQDLISHGISKEVADILLSQDISPADIQRLNSELLPMQELYSSDSSPVSQFMSMLTKDTMRPHTLNEVLTRTEQDIFLNTLVSLSPQVAAKLENKESLFAPTILNQVKDIIKKEVNDEKDPLVANTLSPSTSGIFDLLKSPEYQKMMKEELLSHLTFQIKDLLKKDSLPQFYKKYSRDLDTLLKFFENSENNANSQNYQQAKEQAFKMRDQLEFMKSINQFLGYVQLPVKLSKDYINSELFFYTNRRHTRESAHNLHVLLHLSMTHLGQIDIHLKLYKKTVHAKLMLEQKEALYLLNSNINQLSDGLLEQGYGFTYEFEEMKQKQTTVDRMLLHNNKDVLSQCYTFDTKA